MKVEQHIQGMPNTRGFIGGLTVPKLCPSRSNVSKQFQTKPKIRRLKGKEKNGIIALKEIASGLPFFKTLNERQKLLGVVVALVLLQVSLSEAAEIMGMGKDAFLELTDAMRVEFSYREESEVETEAKWRRKPSLTAPLSYF